MAADEARFRFELARPGDDADLRRLVRESPVPGSVKVAYEREPSYFAATACHGPFCQVIVAREAGSDGVAGLAVRAVRMLYVGGTPEPVGYLGQLRVAPRYRGRWLLSAGFSYLRRLHEDGRTPVYLTTLVEGNREARALLVERPRRGFPRYRPLGKLVTRAIPARDARPVALPGARIEPAAAGQLPEVLEFLSVEGACRPLFPVFSEADLAGRGAYPGLVPGDVLVARREGSIRGVAGLWDPTAVRQAVVHGYSGLLAGARAAIGLLARLAGAPPLPAPGERLRFGFAAFPCVAGDDPALFASLLCGLRSRAAEKGLDWVTLGLLEGDPLLPAARHRFARSYRSALYTVAWEGDDELRRSLGERVPHVELAAL